jgi:hypothetical protein
MLRKITNDDFFLTKEFYYTILDNFFNGDGKFKERFFLNSSSTINKNGKRYGYSHEFFYNRPEDDIEIVLNYTKLFETQPNPNTQGLIQVNKKAIANSEITFRCGLTDILYEDGLAFFERFFQRHDVLSSSVRFQIESYEVFCRIVIGAETWDKICQSKNILVGKEVLMLGESAKQLEKQC